MIDPKAHVWSRDREHLAKHCIRCGVPLIPHNPGAYSNADLESLREREDCSYDSSFEHQDSISMAVASVLSIHAKTPARYYGTDLNPDRQYDCQGCGEGRAWPCSTVYVIHKHAGHIFNS